jgi:hypothetical protein
VAALIAAWIVCSGAILTTFFIAQARSTERMMEDMGLRFGATSAEFHVNWLAALPQLIAYYAVIVLVPPTLLWFLWRRARST